MVCRVRKTELIETKWEEIDFDKAERSRIFFNVYLDLINGSYDPVTFRQNEAVSRKDALEILTRNSGFNSTAACRQFLSEYIAKRRKAGAAKCAPELTRPIRRGCA
jgi:hypothetical protein